MAFSRLAENRIREAMAAGKFDNLSRAGERLDLEEYFSAPEELRMAYSILKNAKCTPVEVELLNEISRLKDRLAQTIDEVEREIVQQSLARRQTELAVMLERRRRHER